MATREVASISKPRRIVSLLQNWVTLEPKPLNIEENSEYDLTLIQVSSIVGIDKIIHLKYFSDLVKEIITKYDYRLIEKGKKLSVFKRKVIADEN